MHAVRLYTPRMEKRIVGYLRKSDRVATLQHLECVVDEEECCKSVFARTSRSIRSPSIVCVRFVCWVFVCWFVVVRMMMNAVDAPCRR